MKACGTPQPTAQIFSMSSCGLDGHRNQGKSVSFLMAVGMLMLPYCTGFPILLPVDSGQLVPESDAQMPLCHICIDAVGGRYMMAKDPIRVRRAAKMMPRTKYQSKRRSTRTH